MLTATQLAGKIRTVELAGKQCALAALSATWEIIGDA
jgi:hypothetical protein